MPTILENLKSALAIIEDFLATHIDLEQYVKKEKGCGTLFCGAGLLATKPEFTSQINWRGTYFGYKPGEITLQAVILANHEPLWGPGSFYRLFARRGEGSNDHNFKDWKTDKELLIARFKFAIQQEEENATPT